MQASKIVWKKLYGVQLVVELYSLSDAVDKTYELLQRFKNTKM